MNKKNAPKVDPFQIVYESYRATAAYPEIDEIARDIAESFSLFAEAVEDVLKRFKSEGTLLEEVVNEPKISF